MAEMIKGGRTGAAAMQFVLLTSVISFGLAMQAADARAEFLYFRTPSKNIHCAYMDYEGVPNVRCDIMAYTPSITTPPADCDLDWGMAYSITADGIKGEMLCVGDTVNTPDAKPLPYGATFRRSTITCISEKTGLTCTNGRGHGFFLSKAEQRVF
jgi:hypothetical protein